MVFQFALILGRIVDHAGHGFKVGLPNKKARIIRAIHFAIDIEKLRPELILKLFQELIGNGVLRPDEHGRDFIAIQKGERIGHFSIVEVIVQLASIISLAAASAMIFVIGIGHKASVLRKIDHRG